MSKSLPERPDLDQLKRQAKELLENIRDGRPEALARCGGENTADFALGDAQRVLAREYGFTNWAKLKLHVETRTEDAAEARLIEASLGDDEESVRAILAGRPALARRSVFAAAALGDATGVVRSLERDAAAAVVKGGPRGWVPLLYLCFGRRGGGDAERVVAAKALLAAGADANAHWVDPLWPDSREAALYGAVGVNNYPQVARVLLEAGANPNDGESTYHAAEYFHRESLEVLALYGADFSGRQEPWGNTPLYFLLGGFNKAPSVCAGIRWLLEHGVDANVRCTALRETALHHAARNGWDADTISLLLGHGADPCARRGDGRTPLALAVRVGSVGVGRVLRAAGAPDDVPSMDRFLGACLRNDEKEARAWLEKIPAGVGGLSPDEARVVHEAAKRGGAEALGLMGKLGLHLAVDGEAGETALHIAAWHGRAGAVRVLIEAGVPLDAGDRRFGAPAIGWCAHGSRYCNTTEGDYAAVARLLIGAGAKVPKGTQGSPAVMAVLKERTRKGE